MNQETREAFKLRFKVMRFLRRFLEEHGFIEVETPVLANKASGASATPFKTRHQALDIEVFLRIAPETYLKRCIVGGFDRVYEFARCFRNEGMDASHLQDFTLLEFYAAYWNYEDNMDFTEDMVKGMIQEISGGDKISFRGQEVDFSGAWPRRPLRDLILEKTTIDIHEVNNAETLRAKIKELNIELDKDEKEVAKLGFGNLVDILYKRTVRPDLINPVFIIKHPVALSPLARRNDQDGRVADRFQLVVAGWEIVNAYSELVDPVDQRTRLEEQSCLKAAGDAEAMELDEDYLMAMEYGMPPAAGFWSLQCSSVWIRSSSKNQRSCHGSNLPWTDAQE